MKMNGRDRAMYTVRRTTYRGAYGWSIGGAIFVRHERTARQIAGLIKTRLALKGPWSEMHQRCSDAIDVLIREETP